MSAHGPPLHLQLRVGGGASAHGPELRYRAAILHQASWSEVCGTRSRCLGSGLTRLGTGETRSDSYFITQVLFYFPGVVKGLCGWLTEWTLPSPRCYLLCSGFCFPLSWRSSCVHSWKVQSASGELRTGELAFPGPPVSGGSGLTIWCLLEPWGHLVSKPAIAVVSTRAFHPHVSAPVVWGHGGRRAPVVPARPQSPEFPVGVVRLTRGHPRARWTDTGSCPRPLEGSVEIPNSSMGGDPESASGFPRDPPANGWPSLPCLVPSSPSHAPPHRCLAKCWSRKISSLLLSALPHLPLTLHPWSCNSLQALVWPWALGWNPKLQFTLLIFLLFLK